MSCTMDHHAMISDNHSKFDNMKAWVKTQKNYFSSCNLLLLHRELKDHIVSAYFQSSERLKNVNKSLPEYIRSDNFGLENIIKYNLFWKEDVDVKSRYVFTYEELKYNTIEKIKESAKFCGYTLSDDMLSSSIDHFSFDKMKQRETEKSDNKNWYYRTDINNPESFKARRGIIGGYVDYLTQEDIEYCDDLAEKYDYHNRMQLGNK